jgi:DNA-binding beta-propeller fold protein YncE
VNAQLMAPTGVDVDDAGNVYVAEAFGWISKIDTGGIFTTVGGTGVMGYGGDGGPATAAQFDYPFDVAVDSAGNL